MFMNVCASVEAALLHLRIISLTFAATIDSFLFQHSVFHRRISPHINITDRIIIVIIMRINILAVTAVQLSSLPFASANKCRKDLADYHCGAGYQEDGYFNIQHKPDYSNCKCCCEQEDGGGYHRDTCDRGNIKSLDKGCGSCMGKEACKNVSNSKIGDKSCVNNKSCKGMTDSFIKEYSCRSETACEQMERTYVGTNSCGIGKDNTEACNKMGDSTVGDYSCRELNSCSQNKVGAVTAVTRRLGVTSDYIGVHLKIGNNACNLKNVCAQCENYSVVPDDACNGNLSDITDSDCNYCKVSRSSTALRASKLLASSHLLHTQHSAHFPSSIQTSQQPYSPPTTALPRLHSILPRVQQVAAV